MSVILVIGAGVAGLTIADQISASGNKVIIVERENKVGGLARSFSYGNGLSFDIGPHRFHTDDKRVLNFLSDVLSGELIEIGRRSGVFLFSRYLEWPLMAKQVIQLPKSILISCLIDVLRKKKDRDDGSFKSYVIRRYGSTLYEHFFENYTEKFIRQSPQSLDEAWASASINRAVIDAKLQEKSSNLFNLAKGLLTPEAVKTIFQYPSNGPIEKFAQRLSDRIVRNGGDILVGSTCQALDTVDDRVVRCKLSDGTTIELDRIVWTAPVTELYRLLTGNRLRLQFLSTILYNLSIAAPPVTPYQWCYYGGRDILFSRTTCMNHFNSNIIPTGYTALTVEVPCYENDVFWNHPQKFAQLILAHLVKVNALKNFTQVERIDIERVKETYPVYSLGYRDEFGEALSLTQNFSNLHLLGRGGMFWYNNMDHSIAAALSLSDQIVSGNIAVLDRPKEL